MANHFRKELRPVLSNNNEEAQLLEQFLAGDGYAIRIFFERYGGLIRHSVRSVRLSSDAITEEDVFLGAFEHILDEDRKVLRMFKGRCSFTSYLYTVCRRYALNVVQRENKATALFDDISPDDFQDDGAEEIEPYSETEKNVAREALLGLDIDTQIFVKMIFIDKRPVEEIMEFFGWNSVNTVYAKKNKVIHRIKKSVAKLLFEKSSYVIKA